MIAIIVFPHSTHLYLSTYTRTHVPEGCEVLDRPELAQRLKDKFTLTQHELSQLLPPGLTARSVVKVGDQVLQPVPLGQVDWLGGPQHDHAMLSFRITPLVLTHTRKYAPPARGRTRIRLKDWQRMAPALQKELSGGAEAVGKEVQAGTVDVGTAVQNTLRNRHQLAQSWMAPTIRSREHQQRRSTHRSHEQIQLLRTIARVGAALRDGPQVARVTRSQDLVLEDMDVAWSSPLSPQEKLLITSTELWKEYLTASLKMCKNELEKQTNSQIRENRRAMDRRARRAFEDEHKGPSKFADKRVEHRTQEELRWRVPHGLQWVEKHEDHRDAVLASRLAHLSTEGMP